MDDSEEHDLRILEALHRPGYSGFFEVWLRTEFRCFREIHGEPVECKVEVFDGGPDVNPENRWFVVVTRKDDGRRARCNTAPSVEIALATVHWGELE